MAFLSCVFRYPFVWSGNSIYAPEPHCIGRFLRLVWLYISLVIRTNLMKCLLNLIRHIRWNMHGCTSHQVRTRWPFNNVFNENYSVAYQFWLNNLCINVEISTKRPTQKRNTHCTGRTSGSLVWIKTRDICCASISLERIHW